MSTPVPAVASFDGPRIVVRGARTHNLKNIDIDLPRDRLVVLTGPSGSGKSSLAFDTVFAEGQRRYVESLSVSARQHLAELPKPDADLIEGLSPAVAIAQDTRARNPRATVGTVTEIDDYLRLLFARVGQVHHPKTGAPMQRHSVEDMVEAVLALPEGTHLSVLAPIVRAQPGGHEALLADLTRRGFVRVAIDGEVYDLSETITLDPHTRHSIEVYVDRLKVKEGIRARVADSIETALGLGGGVIEVVTADGRTLTFSEHYAPVGRDLGAEGIEHDAPFPDLVPALFSWNSPHGACPRCDGLGVLTVFDPRLIVPDPNAKMPDAIHPWRGRVSMSMRKQWPALARSLGVDDDARWADLPETAKIAVLEGTGDEAPAGHGKPFEGVRPWLSRRLAEAETKARARDDGDEEDEGTSTVSELRALLGTITCPACGGARVRPEALLVRVAGKTIHALRTMPLRELAAFVQVLELPGEAGEVAEVVLAQVRRRLSFLLEVGLGYLALAREANTLSGGESQRIRLATQVGAALVGITYILDEPSIGLHQRDNERLIAVLLRLRDLGNTVLVVEHDEDTMRAADWLVDVGPGAGVQGGRIVAAGPPAHVMQVEHSPTGRALALRDRSLARTVARAAKAGSTRPPGKQAIVVKGARGHNLKDVTVRFPLGRLTCVTGVSGSGKSSLVTDTLLPEASRILNRAAAVGLPHDAIEGLAALDKVVHVDQSPIGRSPRSNPATYTGIFSELRSIYAQLPEARVRGYTPARFSFNVKGGRCEACQGEGVRRIEMHFLPDLFVTCQTCGGTRYNRETLAVRMRGKSIADVLAMPVAEAYDFFVVHPGVRAKLEILRDVGLGYVALGQSALTLSGGESQRIKLARELGRKATGQTLYILDEPTTGLHFGDVEMLLAVLERLVDEGNTVIVIEHHLDVIRAADHVIDMGPEGGDEGGRVVVAGTPSEVAAHRSSHTGRALSRG